MGIVTVDVVAEIVVPVTVLVVVVLVTVMISVVVVVVTLTVALGRVVVEAAWSTLLCMKPGRKSGGGDGG